MRQSCSMLKGMVTFAGEPCARKPACTVRRGEVEKGLAEIPSGRFLAGRSTKQHLVGPLPY